MNTALNITLFSKQEKNWVLELKNIIKKIENININLNISSHLNEEEGLVFIHENEENCAALIRAHKDEKKVFFIITDKMDQVPAFLVQELADDALIYPFRAVEVLGKLKNFQQHLMWQELDQLNGQLQKMIENFKDDVALSSRLQKQFAPKKFQPMKIFTPFYRYFSGTKPGGNYLDIVPTSQESSYSILLSDSSSYGLSSHVLSMVLNIAVKINAGEWLAPHQAAEFIFKELISTLKEKDRLSLFFGSLSRFNLEFQYIHYGENLFLHEPYGKKFQVIDPTAPALSKNSFLPLPKSQSLKIKPKDRLILISRGLCEELGGENAVVDQINENKDKKTDDLLNELGIELRKKLKKAEKDFPDRDCTISFFEINEKVPQLRKIENAG